MERLLELAHRPTLLSRPRRLVPESAWLEHVPFGMLLIDLLRPRMVVELGTHHGTSYCAFCQAVQELNLDTSCYAVDTWQGDCHTGDYGTQVLNDLRAHHDPLYNGFSTLIQSNFDDALRRFEDSSIDLLHIDGAHGYDAVAHDYHSWRRKVADGGVILLHDICVRREGFGVWRLWDEISADGSSFEFLHGYGLGYYRSDGRAARWQNSWPLVRTPNVPHQRANYSPNSGNA